MTPAGFEPAIPPSERPQAHALARPPGPTMIHRGNTIYSV